MEFINNPQKSPDFLSKSNLQHLESSDIESMEVKGSSLQTMTHSESQWQQICRNDKCAKHT